MIAGGSLPARAGEPEDSADAGEQGRIALTLPAAYARALDRGPAMLAAAGRIGEAEAGRVDADIFPRANPVLEASAGPRVVDGLPTPSFSIGASMSIDGGGGVSARTSAADAAVERSQAERDAEAQRLLRDVGAAFVRGLWAQERLALAQEIETIALETLRATERRKQGGDVSELELNVARIGVARARSALHATTAEREAALGALRVRLGIAGGTELVLIGRLADVDRVELAALLERAKARPDVRALAAELRQAEADLALGDALAAPQIGVGLLYSHEEGANAVLGTLSVSLPVFDHAQGLTARARATQSRAATEALQLGTQARTEVRAAFDVYMRRVHALEALATEELTYEANVRLSKRAYEEGEIGLSDLLSLRREVVAAKLDFLDRKLEARVAGIELQAAAGVLP